MHKSQGLLALLIMETFNNYSPKARWLSGNNCFSIFTQAFVFFETEFILFSFISLSVNFHKTGSRRFENFCFVIFTCILGEYNSLLHQIWPINV
jgi:hypothetical protein